jgi:Heterokaryon incompatibility protein (HET)
MDHLPTPESADMLQIRVPYYGGTYDGGPFMTYLERQGADIYGFLVQAKAIMQPHTVTGVIPELKCESWLDVEFERLIETFTLVNHNEDADMDEAVVELAGLMTSVQDKSLSQQDFKLSEGEASTDQRTKGKVVEKITIRKVLERLDEDYQLKHQQGEMVAAQECISWYRRVVHLARSAFGSDSKSSCHTEQGQDLLLALRKCSEPMPDSLLCTNEPSDMGHLICETLQNWLFFGMLHDVFGKVGVEFQAKDFVESCEDGVYLSTKRLPDYIDAWKTKEAEDLDGREAMGMEIMSNLQWASKVAAEFERVVPFRGIGESALSFSILLLAYTLQQQASIIYGRGFVLAFTSAYLRRRYLASGWCPNQVAAIEASFTLPWQHYIYLTSKDRLDDQSRDLHQHCTVANCGVNQVSRETYRLRHVFNDHGIEFESRCPICHIADGYRKSAPRKNFFEPDMKELLQIVEEGGIPLISIYDVNIEQYNNDPKIVRYDPSRMKYVAISHVWADGLGNPYSNSIHLCQIMMLAKALTELGAAGTNDGRLYFWLDTICVPLEPASARGTAIQSISKVFSQAKYTLVMANDLRRRDVPPTKLETITRILVSNWTRRLWTYSEAMLSNRIAFKYAGDWVDFHETLGELKDEAIQNSNWDFLGALEGVYASITVPWTYSDPITDLVKDLPMLTTAPALDVVQCLAKVRSLGAGTLTKHEITPEHKRVLAFMVLIRGTPWKATSVAFDELICMAQLLNIDVIPILKLSSNRTEALKLLLRTQHAFPRGIIFVDASHMKEDGFRWSPSSYLSDSVNQGDVERLKLTRELALLSNDGLVLEWPGVIFKVTQSISLKDSTHAYYFTFPATVDSKHAEHAYKVLVQSRKEVPPEKSEESWKDMAIILESYEGFPLHEQTNTFGVLAMLLHRTPEICYVQYITRVAVDRVEVGTSENPLWYVDLQAERDDILDHVEMLPPTQAWCLS